MNFPFNCLGCGYENYAEWSHIGQQVFCGQCGRVATVPAPMEPFERQTESGLAVRFACPVCGRNFATKRALVGQKVRCSGCGAGVRVPAGNSFPVENAASVVLNAISAKSRPVAPAAGVTPGAGVATGNSFPVQGTSRGAKSAISTGSRGVGPATGARPGARVPAGHPFPVENASPAACERRIRAAATRRLRRPRRRFGPL